MSLIYRDDLHGYDGLLTFVDVFPTYDEWLKLNDYMYGIAIEDNEYAEKIYNNILLVYKNHFFRFANKPKIYTELSSRLSVLYGQLEVGTWIKENSADIAGTSTINENYKTNNMEDESAPENNTRYRTNIDTTKVDNGNGELLLRDRVSNNADRIQSFISTLRNLFMNHTNEVVIKELYAK